MEAPVNEWCRHCRFQRGGAECVCRLKQLLAPFEKEKARAMRALRDMQAAAQGLKVVMA
ncbi:hypothetical protein MJ904_14105 [Massilia sp. MB5]|uniref:hypothetical protein n=1 Tax=unclassified Massilia TaxID=2609279 RepID=UPI001CBE15ED|nr:MULTISPECIES: hypothetical protein [unclassified Massilia]UMR33191.1 hypothetical protein MJ904_14105 [Massilia sp. MB5]